MTDEDSNTYSFTAKDARESSDYPPALDSTYAFTFDYSNSINDLYETFVLPSGFIKRNYYDDGVFSSGTIDFTYTEDNIDYDMSVVTSNGAYTVTATSPNGLTTTVDDIML